MNDVEFIQEEMPGYTEIKYKVKEVDKKITDFIYEKIEQLIDIRIKSKKIPIYEINVDRYILLKDLYKFEGIDKSSASKRIKAMRENDEFNFPIKTITRYEFNASFPSCIKFNLKKGGRELILLRLPDVIIYLSHAKSISKYHIIKKLIKKIIELQDNELIFLWNELEFFDRELYHKARKWGYGKKLWFCNTYRRFRRVRYRYDSLTGIELPPLDYALILHHDIEKYTDVVIKTLATKNIRWIKQHKKGAYIHKKGGDKRR